jgi:hypothetical protein
MEPAGPGRAELVAHLVAQAAHLLPGLLQLQALRGGGGGRRLRCQQLLLQACNLGTEHLTAAQLCIQLPLQLGQRSAHCGLCL